MLLTGWAKGIPSLTKEAWWLPIIESATSSFLSSIQRLVAQKEYKRARNQMFVALSSYIMACEVEHAETIKLMARLGISGCEDLITREFAGHIIEIIEVFFGKWVEAVKTQDNLVSKRIGRAGLELLLSGVERQVLEVRAPHCHKRAESARLWAARHRQIDAQQWMPRASGNLSGARFTNRKEHGNACR